MSEGRGLEAIAAEVPADLASCSDEAQTTSPADPFRRAMTDSRKPALRRADATTRMARAQMEPTEEVETA